MSAWGGLDAKAFKRLSEKLGSKQVDKLKDEFYRESTQYLGARLFKQAQKNTPVGNYEKGSGRVGGTLRGSWKADEVVKIGQTYNMTISNPVEYAPYVEFGHRTRGKKGWVAGQFMMTKAEIEIRAHMNKYLKRKMGALLKEIMNDGK